MAASHPFFRGGFRPFFFAGAAWAVVALTLWVCTLLGDITLPTALDALAWHRHEMLFGFVGAIMAGFLLTAVPNWTGRLPIAGWPLAGLFSLWAAARLAVLFSSSVTLWLAALLDVGFFVVLGLLAAREVLEANNRNTPVVGMILCSELRTASITANTGVTPLTDIGWQLALSLVVLLISLIGGRIIPSFTRNWMAKRGIAKGLPTQPGRLDLFVIGATAVRLAWLFGTAGNADRHGADRRGGVAGGPLVALARLADLGRPALLILHVGYPGFRSAWPSSASA